MVSKSFNTSSSLTLRRKLSKVLIFVIIILAIGVFVFSFLRSNFGGNDSDYSTDGNPTDPNPSSNNPNDPPTNENLPVKELPPAINFQSIIDSFTKSSSGDKGVIIYDLDRQELAGEYNSSNSFSTASLYKLFVVYEGYKRIESGEWSPDEIAGSTGLTLLQCLDRAIRSSDSPCAEALWKKIGHKELDNILISSYNIQNSTISNLVSTPDDILAIMKLFYYHPDFSSDVLIGQMKDSFLNQPMVNGYDWRQGLPSGFKHANVYNKVGWDFNPNGGYWNLYHDAAIIEFPEEDRHMIIVVMTSRVPLKDIIKLGSDIENKFYQDS